MTMLGRFGVHICITFWIELNVNKICISQATFFVAVAAYIYCNIVFKNVPLCSFWPLLLRHFGDGPVSKPLRYIRDVRVLVRFPYQ